MKTGRARRAGGHAGEVEAELAQARADAAAALREERDASPAGTRRPARVRAPGGDRGPRRRRGAERDAALAASNAGSEGVATAVETALREERLKHNEEINALQQDHAVEFAKANRSHGNAIDAISREYGAKIEALKQDQMRTKAATEGLEKQVSDGVARFAKEHAALTDALAAAREEHAASVVALRKQHALALSSLEKEHASVIASLKADLADKATAVAAAETALAASKQEHAQALETAQTQESVEAAKAYASVKAELAAALSEKASLELRDASHRDACAKLQAALDATKHEVSTSSTKTRHRPAKAEERPRESPRESSTETRGRRPSIARRRRTRNLSKRRRGALQALDAKDKSHAKALEANVKIQKGLKADLDKAAKKASKDDIGKLRKEHAKLLEAAGKQHSASVEALRRSTRLH